MKHSVIGLGVLVLSLSFPATSRLRADQTYRIAAGTLERDLVLAPLSVTLPGAKNAASATVRSLPDGKPSSAQLTSSGSGLVVHWIADGAKKGTKPQWEIRLAEVVTLVTSRVMVSADAKAGPEISADGKAITRYVTSGEKVYKPFFYPVRSPVGGSITRHYPRKQKVEGERSDHPHHRSFWFTHGNVNGVDFWAEGPKTGRIVAGPFKRLSGGELFAHLVSTNDWSTVDGKKILEERRDVRIFPLQSGEQIWDFDLELVATEGPVKFGSTKEGSFGIRTAGTMKETSGGTVESSRGAKGAGKAWGKPAEWVDYHGKVEGKTVGVAIMDHPESFRHPIHWHVRNYGLFAANPFGHRHFYGSKKAAEGEHELKKGESIRFRFRVYFHHGTTSQARVAEVYSGFASPPTLQVAAN